jgi:two-component system OmpR family sensor kinase
MSIRLRLTLWYSTVLAATLLLFGASLYFFLAVTIENQYEENMRKYAEGVEDRIKFGLSLSLKGPSLEIELDETDNFLSRDYYLQVVNLVKGDYSRSSNAVEHRIDIPFNKKTQNKLMNQGDFFETSTIRGHPFLIYHKALIIEEKTVGVLQVAAHVGGNRQFLDKLRNILILSFLFTTIVAASIGWFLARKALKPIDHVIAAAEQIEKGADLDKRIKYEGPNDEIGRLTEKINGMLSRIQSVYSELEEAYRAQRRFVSDASHELRTPLTTIRGNVDLLEKMWRSSQPTDAEAPKERVQLSLEAMRDIADEAQRMSRLVNDLLSLARADAGYQMEKQQIPLKPLVEEVIRRAQFLPRQTEWLTGDLTVLDDVLVYGNKDYLQQLLFIFIENAFKYTTTGHVRMDALASEDHAQIGIRIEDTGVGMDEEEVPQIFERFYRADPSRGRTSGTGLGLSIARWIIDEHQGSIEVKTRKGKGSAFVIWLPILVGTGSHGHIDEL